MFFLKTEPFSELKTLKGISFPPHVTFRQLLITGPPGAGKSTLVRRLGGWSEEGYVDLAFNRWWTAQCLSLRPREIHLGFPFKDIKASLAVFEDAWLDADPPLELDLTRVRIPPPKRYFFSVNWHRRYVFEFLVPPAGILHEWREQRARRGTHPVDVNLRLPLLKRQVEIFLRAALHLQQQGLNVYLREGPEGKPLRILSGPDPAQESRS